MSCGLGSYVSFQDCSYPDAVAQFATVEVPAGLLNDPCPCMPGLNGLTMDGSGLFGTGLFVGGPTTWGAGEFGALAAGTLLLYFVVSATNRTERAYKRQKASVKSTVRKGKRAVSVRARAAKTLFTGEA